MLILLGIPEEFSKPARGAKTKEGFEQSKHAAFRWRFVLEEGKNSDLSGGE